MTQRLGNILLAGTSILLGGVTVLPAQSPEHTPLPASIVSPPAQSAAGEEVLPSSEASLLPS